ncbi:MAG: hypothetical protein RMJ03_04475 [Nitrososphaerota archaeon]|nr:hypothetical protein [Nitrososphaerota archaeon]
MLEVEMQGTGEVACLGKTLLMLLSKYCNPPVLKYNERWVHFNKRGRRQKNWRKIKPS